MDVLVVAWIATGAAQVAVAVFGWFVLRPLVGIVVRLDVAAQVQVRAAEVMAESLARMEGKADLVADDLAVSQHRADEAIERGDEAGVAADEASATPNGDTDQSGQG